MSQIEAANIVDQVEMSHNLRGSLQRAMTYAHQQSHRQVTLEHLLLALVEDREAAVILEASAVDLTALTTDVSAYLGQLEDRLAPSPAEPGKNPQPVPGNDIQHIIQSAAAAAQKSRRREISSALVLAAVVGDGRSPAAQMLRNRGLTFENAIAALKQANSASASQPAPAQTAPGQQPRPAPQRSAPAGATTAAPSPAAPSRPPQATANGDARLQNVQAAHDIIANARERIAAARGAMAANRAPAAVVQEPSAEPVPDESIPQPPSIEAAPAAAPTPMPSPEPATVAEVAAGPEADPKLPSEPVSEPGPEQRDIAEAPAPQNEAGQAPVAVERAQPSAPVPQPPAPPQQMPPQAPPQQRVAPPPQQRAAATVAPVPANASAGAAPLVMPSQYQQTRAPQRPPQPSPPQRPIAAAPQAPQGSRQPPPQQMQQHHGHPGQVPTSHIPAPPVPPSHPGAVVAPPSAQHEPVYAPPGPAGQPHDAMPIEPEKLVADFPSRMCVGKPVTIEIRVPRARLEAWSGGGNDPRAHEEQIITKAMAMRLKAPEGGFTVETASPETQWSEGYVGPLSDDIVSWRWIVTPTRGGRYPLQLNVSTRVVGRDGLAAARALPEQMVSIRNAPNYGRTAGRLAMWVLIASAGTALGYYGERLFTMGTSMLALVIQ